MLPKGRKLILESLEQRRLLAGDISLVRYFDTWDGGTIKSTDPAGLTYHPGSGRLYIADSEINEIPEFTGPNIFEVTLSGDSVAREISSGNSEPTGITYNEFDGFFYVTNDDTHRIYRYDSTLNAPLAEVDTLADTPDAEDPEGITSDPATGTLYVVDGKAGGLQVLVYDAALQFQYRFSIAGEMQDGEGIALDPASGDLFVVSASDKAVFQYTIDGTFVSRYDLSGIFPKVDAPQGLVFAPTSDPTDDPSNLSLYIADGMVDNHPDGRIYETSIIRAGTNIAPRVDAGPSQTLVRGGVADLAGTANDDGLPDGTLSVLWSKVSGPGDVAFDNPNSLRATATFAVPGAYVLRLTANDGELESHDEITVRVLSETAPTETLEVRVASGTDDSEERGSGRILIDSNDLELVLDGSNQIVGIRFTDLNVPAGAAIIRAYVQFQADKATSVDTSLVIHGQASDNAQTFSLTDRDISSRVRTSASVGWLPAPWTTAGEAGPDQRTPDLTGVIQEIIDRPGWAPGHSLALIISGTGQRIAESFEGKSEAAPLLHLEYAVNQAPEVDAGPNQTVMLPDSSSLAGVVNDDGLPSGTLETRWSKVSGPGTVVFGNPGSPQTTASFSATGDYVLRLTASDGELSSYDDITISVEEETEAVETIEVRVSSSTDDAEERSSGRILIDSSDLELVLDGNNQTVGIRFTDLNIPAGAVVKNAYVQFQTDKATSVDTSLVIQGQASDDAQTFSTTNRAVSSRQRTSASVGWSPAPWTTAKEAGLDQRTPDLSGIIQEIVDRPGWALGQSLALIISGTGQRVAASFDGSPEAAPLLHVEFSTGDPLVNQAPVVEAGLAQAVSLQEPAQLAGEVSDDGLPSGTLTTLWSKASGPGDVNFSDPSNPQATATFSMPGTYLLRLEANDGQWTAHDEVTVTVLDDSIAVQTVRSRVSSSTDDAEERGSGRVLIDSSDLELVLDGNNQTVGMRFINLDIPAGATITRAYAQFQTDKATSVDTALVIQGEASDDARTFSTTSRDVSSRPRTSASVDWSPAPWTTAGEAGPDQQTPDLTAIIQEIVDRPGWALGQSLALIISGTGQRVAESYEGNPQAAPLLHVEFTTGDPVVNQAPTVEAGPAQAVTLQETANLAGEADDDGLPSSTLSTLWSTVSGPGTVAFGDPSSLQTTASFSTPGDYVLRLTVYDGELTAHDDVTISVLDEATSVETLEVRVASTTDDAEERSSGRILIDSSDLEFVLDGNNQTVGMRFANLQIPAGSAITRAYIQFQANKATSVDTSVVIQGEAIDDAPTFTTTKRDVSARQRTSAAVDWSPAAWTTAGEAGPDQRTPDLANVIQEIVSRPGWRSGNALALIVSGTGKRVAESYDGQADAAPLLHIEYVSSGDTQSTESTTSETSTLSFQNPDNRMDVDANGTVSPMDALLVLNRLNRQTGEGEGGGTSAKCYWDVNGDSILSPLDALQVINFLNRGSVAAIGEGEATPPVGSDSSEENLRDSNVEATDAIFSSLGSSSTAPHAASLRAADQGTDSEPVSLDHDGDRDDRQEDDLLTLLSAKPNLATKLAP